MHSLARSVFRPSLFRGGPIFQDRNGTVRRFSIKDDRAARHAKVQMGAAGNQNTGFFTPARIGFVAIAGGLAFAYWDINTNPNGSCAKAYKDSGLEKTVKSLYDSTIGQFAATIFEPSSDKLLPDWGSSPYYDNIPPGSPCPPTLVIDLEKTLIGSVYDGKHGWRHARRPGVDKLLRDLSQYYEIVIFSENDIGAAQEILMSVDPEHRCHYLGSAAGQMKGHTLLKRLDFMNRDLSKIILIDDDTEAASLFPRNTLFVSPYTNINDRNDSVLFDLVPLLQAFVHEGFTDLRDAIDSLGTHTAEDAVVEYQMRISRVKSEELAKRNRGLGGLIRGKRSDSLDNEETVSMVRSSILSPKDIVGSSPDGGEGLSAGLLSMNKSSGHFDPKTGKVEERPQGTKKKGALFDYLDQVSKDKEESEMKKQMEMNRLHMERMQKKQQQESS